MAELVAVVAADEQPYSGQLLAAASGGELRRLDQRRDHPRVEAVPQHGSSLDDGAGVRVQPTDAGKDGIRQRVRDAGVASGEGTQVLHDAQGVAGSPRHHLLATPSQAGGRGEGVHRRARQRTERQSGAPVGQLVGERSVLAAQRRHEQHPGPDQPPGEVAEQVDGRRTALLEVVDGQEDRSIARQSAQHGGYGVVRLPALEVDVGRQRRCPRQHGRELGHQRHPGSRMVADQVGQRVGGRSQQSRPQRVDVRLQEQGTFRGVAAPAQHGAAGSVREFGDRVQQPGLANAGFADDQQQALPVRTSDRRPRLLDAAELGLAAEQHHPLLTRGSRGTFSRQVALPKQGDVQLGRRAVRGGTELVAKPSDQPVVHGKTGRRPPVGHECPHQVTYRALVEWVPSGAVGGDSHGRRRVEHGERDGEVMRRSPAQPISLAPDRRHPVGIVLVDQGRLGPQQVESGARRSSAEHVLTRPDPGGRLGTEASRLVEVDPPSPAVRQAVHAARTGDHVRAEEPAGSTDQRRHVGCRVGRWSLRPQGLDDPVDRYRTSALGGQQREQRPGFAAAQRLSGERPRGQVNRDGRAQPDSHRGLALHHAASIDNATMFR